MVRAGITFNEGSRSKKEEWGGLDMNLSGGGGRWGLKKGQGSKAIVLGAQARRNGASFNIQAAVLEW